MELSLGGKLIGAGLFLILTALAAAGQVSLHHVTRARLRSLSNHGEDRIRAILRVLEQPGPSFSTISTLHTLTLAAAACLTLLAAQELSSSRGVGEALGVVLAMLLTALLLQVLGRTTALARPEQTALRLYGVLRVLAVVFGVLVVPMNALERRLLSLFGVNGQGDQSAEQELRMLVESGEQGGMLEQDEREMIHGIFELSEVTAREVMVPRIHVISLPQDALVGQALDLIVTSGHSRLPIYEGSIDEITGFVYAKDVLKHLKYGGLGDPLLPLARAAHFVPEAKKVDELLQELQQRRVHMAVVVDEYGGTAGLITIEDLLEEIVGEIRDEHDQVEEDRVQQISEREAIFDARISIREVNELLSLQLPDDESDTLGGLVYQRLGKVASESDEVRVDGCLISVMSIEGRRIKKVRLLVEAGRGLKRGPTRGLNL